jgi:hypothetical protein
MNGSNIIHNKLMVETVLAVVPSVTYTPRTKIVTWLEAEDTKVDSGHVILPTIYEWVKLITCLLTLTIANITMSVFMMG